MPSNLNEQLFSTVQVRGIQTSERKAQMSVSGIGRASAASLLLQVTQPKVDRPNDGDGDAGDAPKAQATLVPDTGLAANKTA
jgi:hypothetical protein